MKKFFKSLKSAVKFVKNIFTYAAAPALLMSRTALGRKGVMISLLALITYVYAVTDASIGFFGVVFGKTVFTQLPWYGWYMVFSLCVVMYYETCRSIAKGKREVKASEATIEV